MTRALRPWLALLVAASCTGDRAPANDTVAADSSPPPDVPRPGRPSTWNRAAGAFFAVRAATDASAWVVNPAWGEEQALDTLTGAAWSVEGQSLVMINGAQQVGTGRLTGVRTDSTCAGWPTATLLTEAPVGTWRVAFPAGAVSGVTFDSLPVVNAADSAARARAGALAASRVPDDTVAVFRGRPFIVRQASRFPVAPDTVATAYEVVRNVPQEANPLQEQLLILTEEGASRPPEVVFSERAIGVEEAMGSIELLGVLRIQSSGRLALLVRREHEGGFVLEWIERAASGLWTVRWRSAIDAC